MFMYSKSDVSVTRVAMGTTLVILDFIGCGLLPKGAAFRSKKQVRQIVVIYVSLQCTKVKKVKLVEENQIS
jgi:hypothetical protein